MLSGISIWQLLIILLIVVMIFGTKKLRNMGGDLGGAVRSFKKAINEDGQVGTDDTPAADSNKPLEHQADAQQDANFTAQEQEKTK